ncbi:MULTISPECIES: helix-turn-helix transcriptional regulator [Clostridium]|uniref:helix-turn-helix transcriptional regulator n=1 Tax=Clostridium TaxID=1485 RepID=UPI000821DFD3|nr:WYL domain-containing transcriptional regulator [Clostridium saudiense]MDU7453682.1 WYL domain-containing transcriptional regulator [Clostridium saudiense]SCJ87406.1 HTH domain [uncultured Clostridium sp.]
MGKVNNALRMLAILRSRKKVTRKELAEELEVDIRQITRYKEDLEYAGVTITEIKGRYGGYILENKDYLLNLELSDKESLALSKTKDYLKDQGLHFYNDLSSAIEKIKAINPKDNNYNSESIYSKGIKIKANHEEESEKWLTINDGILNNRKLRIKYMDSKGCCTERIVQPYKLYTYYGSNYFIGKCEERNELRQFKLVRIKNIELLEDRFIKDDFDINEYLKNSIGLFKDKTYKIKLKITYPYAMGFKEYSWTEEESIEDYIEKGYLIYNAKVEGKTEVIPWIMGMGTACTVLEPLELKDDIIKAYKEILNQYK